MPHDWRAIAGPLGLGLGLLSGTACVPPPAALEPTAPDAATQANLWEAGSVASLYPVGEVRAWRFRQAGVDIGTSYGRYLGTETDESTGRVLHVFETRIELEVADHDQLQSESRILLDASGRLIRGVERSDAAQLEFASTADTLTTTQGGRQESLTYRPGDGFMGYMTTLHEELMLALSPLPSGEHERRLLSISGGLPRQWVAAARREREGVVVETNLGERIVLKQRRIVEVDVEDDQLRIEAITPAPPWPSWSIAGPRDLRYEPPPGAPFAIEPVELPGRPGDARLAGEILVPNGDPSTKLPAAVLISAAALGDRHGFAGPPPIDLGHHEITDALALAGFAVLRYDQPGFGDSPARAASWSAQLEDARRAVRTLSVHPRVDPRRFILVGHGEGGWKALRLAAEYPDWVRGVALLATPGRGYLELLRERGDELQARLDPSARAEAKAQYERMLDDLANQRGTPTQFADQAQWLYEILAERPDQLVAAVSCPLWIAQGEQDFETDPRTATARLLDASATGQATVRRFAGLDHLFKLEPETSTPARYLTARPVDTGFLAALTTWAGSVVARPIQKKTPAARNLRTSDDSTSH
ncbi:MAG: alpha/beta fold hydrolase [Myxococcales bacterium FL481]|nr:MAG: alpha/beta fold hydrolase [Myxococcales bacterium FL481]